MSIQFSMHEERLTILSHPQNANFFHHTSPLLLLLHYYCIDNNRFAAHGAWCAHILLLLLLELNQFISNAHT